MLRVESRLTRQDGFGPVLKKGTRASNRVLVVSLLRTSSNEAAKAGIVVGKREIPKATARNRVKRRLRHLIAERLSALPAGTRIVVRALAASSDVPSRDLASYLDRLLVAALKKSLPEDAGAR